MKNKILFTLLIIVFTIQSIAQSVAINTDASLPNASAILDIKSITKGLLIPRMTTVQRTAIAAPAKGLIVFDITTNGLWFHNGTAWNVLSSGSATNYWSAAGSDIYNNNAGNVGIGTTTPLGKLHIAGDVKIDGNNSIEFGAGFAKEPNAGKIGYQTFTADALDIVGAGTTGVNRKIKFWNEGGAEFRGSVAIGVTDPLFIYKMDIADRIRIRSSSTSSTAGIALNNSNNSVISAFIGTKDLDLVGIYGSVSGWGLLMNTNTGAIGIGYQNPVAGYRLSVLGNQYIDGLIATTGDAEIGGGASVSGNLNVAGALNVNGTRRSGFLCYAYFSSNAGCSDPASGQTSSFIDYSINATGDIIAPTFIAPSDTRIKNIVDISNSAKDLETINNLQVTDYTMKDKIKYGNKSFKKIIAQQVEEVYPLVVSKHTDYIPDVYQLSSNVEKVATGYLISFNSKHNLGHNAKRLRVLLSETDQMKEVDIVSIPSETQVIINVPEIKEAKIFVYGEEVNDFRTVDYDGLTTLNISATQELSKLIKKQQAIIETQQQQIELLLKRMDGFEKNNPLITVK